jgi:hypothetical protein
MPFSEAVGVVMGVERGSGGAVVRLMDRRGEQKVVAANDILAGKVFPR